MSVFDLLATTEVGDVALEVIVGERTVFAQCQSLGPDLIDIDALRAYMLRQLPEYMIPSVFLPLDNLPETVNGKVDRNALPEPNRMVKAAAAPREEMETWLRDVFGGTLNLSPEQISIEDDFFRIGGDSLKSMVLASRLMDRGITSADIYSLRSIERIAAMLREKKQNDSLDEIEARERKKPHFLSAMQTKLIDYQFARANSTMWNNMYYLFRFNKKTDPERLRKAVNQAVHHHPALLMKISFNENGELVQTCCPEQIPEIRFETCSDMDVIRMKDELVQPFGMINSPLLRVRMFLSERYSYLFFDVHHLAMDGACIGIVLSSIVRAYMGDPLPPDYYCAYLANEDRLRQSPQYLEDKAYFEKQYGGYDWCWIPQPDREEVLPEAAGRVVRLPFDAGDLEAAERRQACVAQADVHRVSVIAQVDAMLQFGQCLVDAHGDAELMATLEVEEGVIVQVEGDGGAM